VAPRTDQSEQPIAEDLYCLTCGYNLRGLYGDPARCPECGALNDLGTAAIPAWRIKKALDGMETTPTLCVAWALLAVFGILLLTANVPVPCALIFFVWTPFAWIVTYVNMKEVYANKPGWRRILLDFHVAMSLFVGWGVALAVLVGVLESRSAVVPRLLAVVVVVGCIPLIFLGRWVYGSAKARIEVMQREAAVRIARDALRRDLHYARRRG